MPDKKPDIYRMSDGMPDEISEYMSAQMPDDCQQECQNIRQIECQEKCEKKYQKVSCFSAYCIIMYNIIYIYMSTPTRNISAIYSFSL